MIHGVTSEMVTVDGSPALPTILGPRRSRIRKPPDQYFLILRWEERTVLLFGYCVVILVNIIIMCRLPVPYFACCVS